MVTKPDFEDFVFYIFVGDGMHLKSVRLQQPNPTRIFRLNVKKSRGSSQGNPYCTNH